MRMKFKSTTLSPRALVYRRFINIETSINLQKLYYTTATMEYWAFDNVSLSFNKIESELVPTSTSVVQIASNTTILQYQSTYFRFNGTSWEKITDVSSAGLTLLSASYNNIGKYQTNKYYFVGSIDCMQKGGVGFSTTQYLKGNIMPLTSLNIKFFNDLIKVLPDDLVVFHDRLFSVESVEEDHKHQPKDYTVHFLTLNSIL